MYGRILIVDDEPHIREGLANLIEKTQSGWIVVGAAEDGKEALQQIEKLRPHLVITDISMPMMSGLELVEYIQRHHIDVMTMILTGYRDFEYAQKALRFGVHDFLLKPSDPGETSEILHKAYNIWLNKVHKETMQKKLQEEHMLRSLCLRIPFEGVVPSPVTEAILVSELWVVEIETYMPNHKQYREQDTALLQFSISNILLELLHQQGLTGKLVSLDAARYALFVKPTGPMDELNAQVARTVYDLLGIRLKLHSCGMVEQLGQLSRLYESYIQKSQSIDTSELLHAYKDTGQLQTINQETIKNLHGMIMAYILIGDLPALRETLDDTAAKSYELDLSEFKVEALALAIALHEIMAEELYGAKENFKIAQQVSHLQQLTEASQVADWLHERKETFLLSLDQWLQGKRENMVTQAVRYIQEHYREECSLNLIAAKVHVTPGYLGNMFKKETGYSLNQYVTQTRLDKAKLYLANTENRVTEIAQDVGFDNPNYFATVFKQWFGVSPLEYRKSQMQ